VDFGEALAEIAAVECKIHFFAMDLPHSDACFVQAYPAETAEAFCDGHNAAFPFFGKVPRSILYDNTTLAVARILGDGVRQRIRVFSELQSHYVFADRFGRPGKGNDKGKVEGLERLPIRLNSRLVKEVSTLLRRVALECLANGLPESVAGALCRLAQRRLELGESLLDWVEVGAVGRQVDELCALRLDRRADPDQFMAAQIVEQDDVIRPQGRCQHLYDIGAKALAIDGAVKHARRGDAAAAQTGHQGGHLPMTVRYRRQ